MGEKVQGISIIGRYKIDREVKNNIENGEAKELTCTTHGHDLRGWGIAGENGGTRWRGAKEENWEYCNSVINKIY